MLDRERHLLVLGRILKDVYTDAAIAPLLGFKGGTCAALFYGLPRISVGLDFDLLTPESAGIVLDRLAAILRRYGSVKDSHVKRNTIFLLLSYGASDRNVKVEV
ncbi:MAG TPA: nucleotidyl transferase AbiEii/AbiGii toxin family protein, partial [archaeon]|nr:nucleotidyl transferase AbiEii/AbiGii toxin family protein [archaeon]